MKRGRKDTVDRPHAVSTLLQIKVVAIQQKRICCYAGHNRVIDNYRLLLIFSPRFSLRVSPIILLFSAYLK